MSSKNQVDKSGKILATESWKNDEEYIKMDDLFNEFRGSYLEPLSEITLKIQEWLSTFSREYYIAQRLKRRPQILRKLLRLHVRLSQLQDIGGCRIIVENNIIVDEMLDYISEKLNKSRYFKLIRTTDYRIAGRDDSGYRAVHLIVERKGRTIEIQIRSKIQHYWAESIERTSVIYGHHLKELEGHPDVISYFKQASDVFYEIECGRKPTPHMKNTLDSMRDIAENIISQNDNKNILYKGFNEKFIRAMIEKDSNLKGKIHNWMLVFDWNTGEFIYWSVIERNIHKANDIYKRMEKEYNPNMGFEVVIIGASDASAIMHTHSHYFGIEKYDRILENIDDSVLAFSKREEIGAMERCILENLYQRNRWGSKKKVNISTLKNHYCKDTEGIEEALDLLSRKGFVIYDPIKGGVALNLKKKARIESYF